MRSAKAFPFDQVVILSTDLRDGAQTPGVNFTLNERLEIARRLRAARVDIIEAGFPISSPLNAAAVQQIAELCGQGDDAPVIASFARTGRVGVSGAFETEDIDAAWRAVRAARYPRIHIVGTGSDIHLREKYRSEHADGRSREENIRVVSKSIKHAVSLMQHAGFDPDVEFSPEDCGRADRVYLKVLFEAAFEAGATTLNVADTVGVSLPGDYGDLVAFLQGEVSCGKQVRWSTHTHDDLGLATANAMAGVMAGARQVEGSFIGLGERAGNTALEQVVTILHMHGERYGSVYTTFDLGQLWHLTHHIAELAKVEISGSAPVVGRNAFRHKSGLHQDGILKHPEVYQAIPPLLVGRTIELELGPESGLAGLLYCFKRLGYDIPMSARRPLYNQFKTLADKIGLVQDHHLEELIKHQPVRLYTSNEVIN